MSDADDLAALLPGRDVKCKGSDIHVRPLYFGQWPKAIKLVRPLANAINSSRLFSVQQTTDEQGKSAVKFNISPDWMASLPQLMEEGGEALMLFFAFCIGKPREWFDTLEGDEGIRLAHAIFAENQDFFVRRILPMLNELGLVKAASQDPAGEQSLPVSEATGTDGTKSN